MKLDINSIVTGAVAAVVGAWLWEVVVRPRVINTENQA